MKSVYVIGATGHIGSYLCPALIPEGFNVVGYSRGNIQAYPEFKREYRSCLRKADRKEAIEQALKENADVICDLIPYTLDDAKYLCERINEYNMQHEIRIISIGSIWVYGVKRKRPITEADEREAKDKYGKNKALIEKYLLDQYKKSGLAVTILHPGHICGKGWLPIGPLGNRDLNVIINIKRGNRIILPDNGEATLQHVHASDIAKMIIRVINNNKSIGETFNVVCEKPISLKNYAEMLYQYYGNKPNIEFVDYKHFMTQLKRQDAVVSAEHIDRSPNVSMRKAKLFLDFEPLYSEKETLIEAIQSIL